MKKTILTSISVLGAGALLYWGFPIFVDSMIEKLDRQAEARYDYNCAHYGADMNRFYGRDVCEDEAVHKSIVNAEK